MKNLFAKFSKAFRKLHFDKVQQPNQFLLKNFSSSMISLRCVGTFVLRVAVFTLHYFLVELPFNDSFNSFSAHQQQQPSLKNQLNSSQSEIDGRSAGEENETAKGKLRSYPALDRIKPQSLVCSRKFQSEIIEWNRSWHNNQVKSTFVYKQQHHIHSEDCQARELQGARFRLRFWLFHRYP